MKSESEVAKSCPTLCDPMDCSLPGSSVHGIFQARVLEWVAIAFSDSCLQCTENELSSHDTIVITAFFYCLNYPIIKELRSFPTFKSQSQ